MHLLQPFAALLIPLNRVSQSICNFPALLPNKLGLYLFAVDRLPPVVARPIGHKLDPVPRFPLHSKYHEGNVKIFPRTFATDIVDFSFTHSPANQFK